MSFFKSMGVINITPNSFSDGGEVLDTSALQRRFDYFSTHQCKLWDIGAESTAPMNQAIDAKEELQRFENYFLPYIDLVPKDIELSIDTYRAETFQQVSKIIQRPLIWNDVSGVLDSSITEVNSCFKAYIFSHNLAPKRELAGRHLEYLAPHHLLEHLVDYFKQALTWWQEQELDLKKLWFDPCFGFSKTREQNLFLIDHIEELIQHFSEQTWVLGVSKKSFLRPIGDKTAEAFERAEQRHQEILTKWREKLQSYKVIIRLHDPKFFRPEP